MGAVTVIVSHKYRFIFLHSRKTAGSSVSLSLLRFLDRDDLWLNAPAHGIMADALRRGFVPGPATHPVVRRALSRQCGEAFTHRSMNKPAGLSRDERLMFAKAYNSLQLPHPKPDGWQHVSAAAAREHLGAEVWDSYFKFSFERNPWDRMASLYWWRMRADRDAGPALSFRDFIAAMHSGDRSRMRANRAMSHSNWHIYTINDRVALSHIGRYERLADELGWVLDKLGVPFDGWLPRSKHRTRQGSLEDLYDEVTVKLVGEIFHREIELLGYRSPLASTLHSAA